MLTSIKISRILTLSYILIIFIFACKRNLVDNSLHRTDIKMQKFVDVLVDAQNGWNVCIQNKEGMFHHFWMKFSKNGKVEMKGDNVPNGDKIWESLYTIRELQQPTLNFSTYNYISRLGDPDLPDLSGNLGKSLKFDIQYAFSEALVKALGESQNNKIASFTLSGRLYKTKAWFSRVGTEGIIAEKTLGIMRKLNALRWTCNKSLNFLTVNDNGNNLDNQYIYDLHTGGTGTPYTNILGLTNLERRGAILRYTFDCKGDMQMQKAEDIPKRLSMYDAKIETDWLSSRYYDFQLTDSTRLTFKKQIIGDAKVLTVTMEAKDIDDCMDNHSLGKLCNNSDQQLLKSDTEAMFKVHNDYIFYGWTQRNLRDYWNVRQDGTRNLSWSFFKFNGDNYHYLFLTFKQNLEPFSLVGMRHLTQSSYKDYIFTTNNYHFLFIYYNRRFIPLLNIGIKQYNFYLTEANNARIYSNFFSKDIYNDVWIQSQETEPTPSQDRQNSYTLVPTIMGFQFHRQKNQNNQTCANTPSSNTKPSGILALLYLPNDLD